jgi:hypothetical protein
MRGWAGLIGPLVAAGLATGACAESPSALQCRHTLAVAASVRQLPPSVIALFKPWMALHGETWNDGDVISKGDLTASFAWAARSEGGWVVAYHVGGRVCCRMRFALFTPTHQHAGSYRQVVPPFPGPDYFSDVSCKGIDPALDAFASGT